MGLGGISGVHTCQQPSPAAITMSKLYIVGPATWLSPSTGLGKAWSQHWQLRACRCGGNNAKCPSPAMLLLQQAAPPSLPRLEEPSAPVSSLLIRFVPRGLPCDSVVPIGFPAALISILNPRRGIVRGGGRRRRRRRGRRGGDGPFPRGLVGGAVVVVGLAGAGVHMG